MHSQPTHQATHVNNLCIELRDEKAHNAGMTQHTTTPPKPGDIKAQRLAHGHTQAQAAELVYMPARTWQKWEAGDNRMHPAAWELYRLKCAMLKNNLQRDKKS